MTTRLQLRDYQEECMAALFSWFSHHAEGNPIVSAPTGSGKSLMMAEFVRRVLEINPATRFVVLAHVKELLQQNHDEFCQNWGVDAPAGIYSAGLDRREADAQVLFAGIASIHRNPGVIGPRDVVMVDECHLVPSGKRGMYPKVLSHLKTVRPLSRAVGWTATPFRTGEGWIHKDEESIWSAICFEIPIERLIREGHLVPAESKAAVAGIDMTGVRVDRGDFIDAQVQDAALRNVDAAVAEMVDVAQARGRRKWLVFCAGIDHADEVAKRLESRGIRSATIYGTTSRDERSGHIERFRNGEITALVNVGVLTTGFNVKDVDLVAIMRATKSESLYIQIVGRGLRTFPGKDSCTVLDYGENVLRHGPVNRVRIKTKGEGDAPTRVCPECQEVVMLSDKQCSACGFVFPPPDREPNAKNERLASDLQAIQLEVPKPERCEVSGVFYKAHNKPGKPTSLKVTYICGLRSVSEWVCFEHEGFARRKAEQWWQESASNPPASVEEALERTNELARPEAITVDFSGRYPSVVRRHFP